MFNNLSERFARICKNISGQGRLTDENIQQTLRDVRSALLEADVALPIIKDFVEQLRELAKGQEVQLGLNPGQAMIKIVHQQLVKIMGEANAELNLNCPPPAVILMAGLQGSGKTTTVGKLARWLSEQKKTVMVASCDIYRPAAIEQLKTIAQQLEVKFFEHDPQLNAVEIATNAIASAKTQFADVIIIDTAGRLHIDDEMMTEIKQIHAAVKPIETLFVVDSMTGQDAAKTALAFHQALPLTGIILTKIDGDARGGAALSMRQITGKPIKFLGVGEKLTALEPFHPDRIASRILGMGDVLTLIEDIEKKVDRKKAEKLSKKIKKGKTFDLNDFREQLQQMQNMGGMMSLMTKIPGMSQIPDALKNQFDDKHFKRIAVMIDSMTKQERRFPAVINGSRKRRITQGSGTQIQDLNNLLKQFKQMQKMMKKLSKGGMKKAMRQMQGMLPPGGLGGGGAGGLGGMGGFPPGGGLM